ncbi:MFS transporter [Konateibacter massiliensis]|uniref:MFS transporter n=1 Tax=Konateibacter massiliensis TaxID=2002841 RepID=UPI000C16059E|nr:MFS transporter [Konateibacter massiliensis]
MSKKKEILAYISMSVIMVALGASDAMRGIFALIFENHFALTTAQLSMIVTISYVGNLVFLLIGGKIADRFQKKAVSLGIMSIWCLAALLYIVTDNYYVLLIGMFFTMGASTLMNTLINIMTPALFASAPAMIINTLFFVQGIGTTGSQKLAGKYAENITSWKVTNGILIGIAVVGIILLALTPMEEPDKSPQKQSGGKKGFKEVVQNRAFLYLVFILGCYFVAEHGILNWFVSYAHNSLGLPVAKASTYLSLFFGGITVGRLIFAPLVAKLGIQKSIKLFGGVAALFYTIGIFMGAKGVLVLSLGGIFFSVLYPTLIMMIQSYFDRDIVSTATGSIISIATIFDIIFNIVFGYLVDRIGFARGFIILPVTMCIFYLIFHVFDRRISVIGVNENGNY